MRISRRKVLSLAGTSAALASLAPHRLFAADAASGLKSMTTDVVPIGRTEYLARIDQARALMGKHDIGALLVEPGASLVYFTGVEWWRSERLTAAVIPREGDVVIVTPHFEEPSVRESLRIPADVRVWNEDENPLVTVAGVLRDRKVTAPVGVEETVRYFAVDALQRAMPGVRVVNGAPVVRGCRMV
jgi:Xaa-Pro dipeptidase